MTIDLTEHQQLAATGVQNWYKDKESHIEKPIYRLFGYAGTGKTTITNQIIKQLKLTMGEEVLFGAYTGKAAMVMRRNLLPASTIHSMIYKVIEPDEKSVEAIRKELRNDYLTDHERGLIKQRLHEASRPRFQVKDVSDPTMKTARLIVLDECSMVNHEMLGDLLSFEIPLLVLGDPGQLPPIEGKSPLTDVAPDAMLTEIHRQAEGNPVIWLATKAREGYRLPYDTYGDSRVVHRSELTKKQMLSFDQILVGKNVTRRQINTRMRELKGYKDRYPVVGEKLICLRNNQEDKLFNGMICYVEEVGKADRTGIELKIRRENDRDDQPPTTVRALRAHFDAYYDEHALDNVRLRDKMECNEFDYGYAITVHKAQGSQWDNVCLIDDGMFDGWGDPIDRKRWMYTGITRAVEKITIAR